jgi:hypothetical protein
MVVETRKRFADLLRAAASQQISESGFWDTFKGLELPADDPIARFAYESATHFWGNFHERNLLLMRSKPDRHQVQQGRDHLNLIADGLDGDWPASELKRRLDDI